MMTLHIFILPSDKLCTLPCSVLTQFSLLLHHHPSRILWCCRYFLQSKRSTSRRVPAEYWNLNSPVFNPIYSLKIHREMKMRSSSPPSTLLQDSKFIQQHRVSPKQLKELEGKNEHIKAPYSSSGRNPGLQKPREPKHVFENTLFTPFF